MLPPCPGEVEGRMWQSPRRDPLFYQRVSKGPFSPAAHYYVNIVVVVFAVNTKILSPPPFFMTAPTSSSSHTASITKAAPWKNEDRVAAIFHQKRKHTPDGVL